MGHRDRATTDRYTTIDRMEAGKVLKAMSRIEKKKQKKSPTNEEKRSGQGKKMARIGKLHIKSS